MTNLYEETSEEVLENEAEEEIGEIEGQMSLELPPEEPLPVLDEEQVMAAVEAILFTMGKAVELDAIAKAVELTTVQLREVLQEMQREYATSRRGIMLMYLEDKVQLCTKTEYYRHLIRIASQPKRQVLTEVMLETLSIIAYKQPITKGDIERIRGVKSDFGVNKLMEYGLVEEVGRLEAPGRPILFATTEEFLRRFGMSSVESLPQMDPDTIASIQEEAESEITVTV